MNAIVDLTARAVSLITAIQTSLLRGSVTQINSNIKINREKEISVLNILPKEFESTLKLIIELEENVILGESKKSKEASFTLRAEELVWISKREVDTPKSVEYTINLCVALINWIWNNEANGINDLRKEKGSYPTPFNWREAISNILYTIPEERVRLASALQYIPIEIVLALGGGSYEGHSQRIMQMWNVSDVDQKALLTPEEIKVLRKVKQLEEDSEVDVETLLKDDNKLIKYLLKNEAPLSFEDVFKLELKEIQKNRAWRQKELHVTGSIDYIEPEEYLPIRDPFQKGREMGLYALAFSGGGIRSATFNLGVLQGLATHNLLNKFDYLSTVSGGGYIGSWLAAWIKREGSVVKVTNRLCPDKSPNPLGEELKPIRWLRMFSNYLAPRSSIMSADAWTVGVTWLRNTLLNQIIIFLLLLSLLFLGNLLYELWLSDFKWKDTSWQYVLSISAILLIPISLLAGFGMLMYSSEAIRFVGIRREHTNKLSKLMIFFGTLVAYLLSAWLHSHIEPSTLSKLDILLPSAFITFLSLFLVAVLGKYDQDIRKFGNGVFGTWVILIVTTLIATVIGLLCLVAAWTILEHIKAKNFCMAEVPVADELQFILGLPLVLEVFSITVVVRMALLGKYFPDERREWWGRMGAYIHRISFLWILIATSALLGQVFVDILFEKVWKGIAATGGWIALVGSTVKAAFSSKTSNKKDENSYLSQLLNVLSLAGPYLFALGLLIFLPGLIRPILFLADQVVRSAHFLTVNILGLATKVMIRPDFQPPVTTHLYIDLKILCVMLISVLSAYFLAKQVGVNEFSMYHFYRNRLVRAYLGASRRSTDRQRTSNPFTGFDNLDDEKLSKMRNEYGYYGPYPILNTALNASQVSDLDRQDRMAESFIFSPLFCGFDFSMIKASVDVNTKSYDYAFRETEHYAFKDGGPTIGTAMATSGAAVNPNQGYHSSTATAFLLTVFNVQLGRWIGNPRKCTWQLADPGFGLGYIVNNLVGKTNTRNDFIALSDGGHFDNMGLYEMVRRRCAFIVVCDAEQDDQFTCEGFANAIRRCRIDFGAEIVINLASITERAHHRFSAANYALGDIFYAGNKENTGKLLYIKSSLVDRNIPFDVQEYASKNETFPHQSTGDQFFDEEQFESYRKLGFYIANCAFKDNKVREKLKL
ncbi:hypothetical protein GCM10028803_46480 [Larkinella knui]|uniref:PNPLA domain-containing protein n=1 Tax=Larkinella knui TaxID=2025310 RepID=A0A3P1CPJ6_9BACT|nr:patatin-like phospholipase family protein [Larkinella knui]RRB15241.1 hypothetical protein EHT87_11915 [Larkinella knui]